MLGNQVQEKRPDLAEQIFITKMFASGFILTSLLWASALAAIIDRSLRRAAIYFWICGALTLFGIIHSPLAGSAAFVPWKLHGHDLSMVMRFAIGYLFVGGLMFAWSYLPEAESQALETSGEHDA